MIRQCFAVFSLLGTALLAQKTSFEVASVKLNTSGSTTSLETDIAFASGIVHVGRPVACGGAGCGSVTKFA
jgi:hypothetical protein